MNDTPVSASVRREAALLAEDDPRQIELLRLETIHASHYHGASRYRVDDQVVLMEASKRLTDARRAAHPEVWAKADSDRNHYLKTGKWPK